MTISTDLAQRLSQHHQQLQAQSLSALFADPSRVQSLSVEAAQLTLDFSKHFCTAETLQLFAELCDQLQLRSRIEDLFNGAIVNGTEQRPALHTSLRTDDSQAPNHNDVARAQADMQRLVDALHAKRLSGFDGRPFTDLVHIGIGGSDLGPRFVTTAMHAFKSDKLRVHFAANVDPTELTDILRELDPATTLISTASKSFTTLETLSNTTAARAWLQAAAGTRNVDQHFIAITANPAKAQAFGIPASQILPMWDWVGGRYSLWSAIGLPIAVAVGWEHFKALLNGAAAMDSHFRNTPFTANMPALLGFIEWWYSTYWQAHSALVLPYSHRLRLFPAFLQQLSMESLGKGVDIAGLPLSGHSGLVIWGEPGTNSQHSFMQLLHQGTRFIPVDFIAVMNSECEDDERHTHLLANCLSQSRTLMVGKSLDQAEQELLAAGMSQEQVRTLAPHKVHPGNRPSSTLVLDTLNPESLGALIALYEHKVFTQSVLWNINAFDQWGVELGKQSAASIFSALTGDGSQSFDPSTAQMIERFKSLQE
ncbi:MAG: glucose-6-phosphate isomerase [Spongiibacteraceae bacterium]